VGIEDDPAKVPAGAHVPIYDLCLVPYGQVHQTKGHYDDTHDTLGGTPQGGLGSEQPVIAPPEAQKESISKKGDDMPVISQESVDKLVEMVHTAYTHSAKESTPFLNKNQEAPKVYQAGQVPEEGTGLNGDAKRMNVKDKDVSPEELKMGIEEEMEHTDDPDVAKRIALDHLATRKDYYTVLAQAEKTMQKRNPTEMDIDDVTGHTPAKETATDSKTFTQELGYENPKQPYKYFEPLEEALQSIVVKKGGKAKNLADARKIASKFGKGDVEVDETGSSWRFRQQEPGGFSRIRTKVIDDDVSLIVGALKNQK
jgi:hypothetical protein